jgi:hypothetical protein
MSASMGKDYPVYYGTKKRFETTSQISIFNKDMCVWARGFAP